MQISCRFIHANGRLDVTSSDIADLIAIAVCVSELYPACICDLTHEGKSRPYVIQNLLAHLRSNMRDRWLLPQ